MPLVAPQVQSYLTVVQDMDKILAILAQWTDENRLLSPQVQICIVWKGVMCCV